MTTPEVGDPFGLEGEGGRMTSGGATGKSS